MWKSVKLCSSLEFIMQRQKRNVLSLSKGIGTQICCIIDSGGGRCACGGCLSCGACCCNGCSGSACTCHCGCNGRCGNCESTCTRCTRCTASARWQFRDLTKSTVQKIHGDQWVFLWDFFTTWDLPPPSIFNFWHLLMNCLVFFGLQTSRVFFLIAFKAPLRGLLPWRRQSPLHPCSCRGCLPHFGPHAQLPGSGFRGVTVVRCSESAFCFAWRKWMTSREIMLQFLW